ncbi:methyltransferase domain-containing protein [Candidatus Bathyarchaeota archaeon]|nr:methyltransferase domain-containing protein [Candidatus Bathyarchaeota archaeon]
MPRPDQGRHPESGGCGHRDRVLGNVSFPGPIDRSPPAAANRPPSDFADAYPDTEVIGIDISPIQPSWTSPNLKFEIDDCGLPWTFEPDSIDFVHIRYMAGSIKDWPFLFKEAYRCTKPGGWLQSFDANGIVDSDDGTVKPNSAIQQWGEFFIEGGKALGRPFTLLDDNTQRLGMEAAGFVDIQSRDVSVRQTQPCIVPASTWLLC